MKGYRFYVNFDSNKEKRANPLSKNTLKHPQNCIALFLDEKDRPIYQIIDKEIVFEGFSAVYFTQDSPVNVGGISDKYLRDKCTRCSEELARLLHPALFLRLDEKEI